MTANTTYTAGVLFLKHLTYISSNPGRLERDSFCRGRFGGAGFPCPEPGAGTGEQRSVRYAGLPYPAPLQSRDRDVADAFSLMTLSSVKEA